MDPLTILLITLGVVAFFGFLSWAILVGHSMYERYQSAKPFVIPPLHEDGIPKTTYEKIDELAGQLENRTFTIVDREKQREEVTKCARNILGTDTPPFTENIKAKDYFEKLQLDLMKMRKDEPKDVNENAKETDTLINKSDFKK